MNQISKSNSFSLLNLSHEIMQVISSSGFTQMTQVQSECIPLLLAGHDLVGQSKTGSGKTAAFVIPILQKIDTTNQKPQALIMCPTRELCDQVYNQALKFSKYILNLKIVELAGGRSHADQLEKLANGAQLLVGTPGRVLEHLKSSNFKFHDLKTLVLDEADRLLDDAFSDEIKAIIELLPSERQTIFFSATFPEVMNELSLKYQNNPKKVSIKDTENSKLQIQQFIYKAEKPEKMQMLLKILKNHPSKCTLIFCRTKVAVDEIGKLLKLEKVTCEVLHADLKQNIRDAATTAFRNGKLNALVATDVAARGLDIDILQLIINFDLPAHVETYIHRIGRTGRAGRKGCAVTIATDYETDLVKKIEAATGIAMIQG